MKRIYPSYYEKFSCIASECKHNCCIGWEIDIDKDTAEYYKNAECSLSKKLSENIDYDDVPHFILSENERCPFLADDNLCEIIKVLGEDSLCEICREHPRFTNFFADREEIGLGLCCEEAARIILTENERVSLVCFDDASGESLLDALENEILTVREDAVRIIQDRSRPLCERVDELISKYKIATVFSTARMAEMLRPLERLDAAWDGIIDKLVRTECSDIRYGDAVHETALEQILVYLVYRHLPTALDVDDIAVRLSFALFGYSVIKAIMLCIKKENGACTVEEAIEVARQYSSEIEYSEENTESLCNKLYMYGMEI